MAVGITMFPPSMVFLFSLVLASELHLHRLPLTASGLQITLNEGQAKRPQTSSQTEDNHQAAGRAMALLQQHPSPPPPRQPGFRTVHWEPELPARTVEVIVWAVAVNRVKFEAFDDPAKWDFRLVPLTLDGTELAKRVQGQGLETQLPPQKSHEEMEQYEGWPTATEHLYTLPAQEYYARELEEGDERQRQDELAYKDLNQPGLEEILAKMSVNTNRCMGPPLPPREAVAKKGKRSRRRAPDFDSERFHETVAKISQATTLLTSLALDLALEERGRRTKQPKTVQDSYENEEAMESLKRFDEFAFLSLRGEHRHPVLLVGIAGLEDALLFRALLMLKRAKKEITEEKQRTLLENYTRKRYGSMTDEEKLQESAISFLCYAEPDVVLKPLPPHRIVGAWSLGGMGDGSKKQAAQPRRLSSFLSFLSGSAVTATPEAALKHQMVDKDANEITDAASPLVTVAPSPSPSPGQNEEETLKQFEKNKNMESLLQNCHSRLPTRVHRAALSVLLQLGTHFRGQPVYGFALTSRADFKREEMRAYQLGEAWEGTKDLMANVAVYSVKAGTEAVRLTAVAAENLKPFMHEGFVWGKDLLRATKGVTLGLAEFLKNSLPGMGTLVGAMASSAAANPLFLQALTGSATLFIATGVAEKAGSALWKGASTVYSAVAGKEPDQPVTEDVSWWKNGLAEHGGTAIKVAAVAAATAIATQTTFKMIDRSRRRRAARSELTERALKLLEAPRDYLRFVHSQEASGEELLRASEIQAEHQQHAHGQGHGGHLKIKNGEVDDAEYEDEIENEDGPTDDDDDEEMEEAFMQMELRPPSSSWTPMATSQQQEDECGTLNEDGAALLNEMERAALQLSILHLSGSEDTNTKRLAAAYNAIEVVRQQSGVAVEGRAAKVVLAPIPGFTKSTAQKCEGAAEGQDDEGEEDDEDDKRADQVPVRSRMRQHLEFDGVQRDQITIARAPILLDLLMVFFTTGFLHFTDTQEAADEILTRKAAPAVGSRMMSPMKGKGKTTTHAATMSELLPPTQAQPQPPFFTGSFLSVGAGREWDAGKSQRSAGSSFVAVRDPSDEDEKPSGDHNEEEVGKEAVAAVDGREDDEDEPAEAEKDAPVDPAAFLTTNKDDSHSPGQPQHKLRDFVLQAQVFGFDKESALQFFFAPLLGSSSSGEFLETAAPFGTRPDPPHARQLLFTGRKFVLGETGGRVDGKDATPAAGRNFFYHHSVKDDCVIGGDEDPLATANYNVQNLWLRVTTREL
eukprot:g14897.t1